MLNMVLVGRDLPLFAEFAATLQGADGVSLKQLSSGEDLLAAVAREKIDVVILGEELEDSSGLQFSETLMKRQPLINCAISSDLPAKQFHEKTEGLGIFMQLPLQPGVEDAKKMLELLESINALMG